MFKGTLFLIAYAQYHPNRLFLPFQLLANYLPFRLIKTPRFQATSALSSRLSQRGCRGDRVIGMIKSIF